MGAKTKRRCNNRKGRSKTHKSRSQILREYRNKNVTDTQIENRTKVDFTAMYLHSLWKEFGFGSKRLVRWYKQCVYQSEHIRGNWLTIEDIEQYMKDTTKWTYEREDKTGFSHQNQIRLKTIEDLSILFAFACHEEFGFSNRRLLKLRQALCECSRQMKEGKISTSDLLLELLNKAKFDLYTELKKGD